VTSLLIDPAPHFLDYVARADLGAKI